MKKCSMVLVALVLFSATLLAAPMNVSWEWMLDNPKVTNFRFQVNGEDPEQWIVVDASVTKYEAEVLDGSQAYTLYLQQSFDGVLYSESAKSTVKPLPPPKPAFAVEEEVLEVEVASIEEEMVAKSDKRFKTTIAIGTYGSFMVDPIYTAPPTLHQINLEAALDLKFKNILSMNRIFGLGLDIGVAYTPFLDSSYGWTSTLEHIGTDFNGTMDYFTQAGRASIAPMLNMQFGKLEVDLGGGRFVTYGPEFTSTKGETYVYGGFAKLAIAYQFNRWFSLGVDAKYHYVLFDYNSIPTFVAAGVFMGLSL